MVFSQLYYITNREEIFIFGNKKMPYLCGLWRFANAYKIYFMKGEKIVEEGTHKELMRKKGEYYKLYNKEG